MPVSSVLSAMFFGDSWAVIVRALANDHDDAISKATSQADQAKEHEALTWLMIFLFLLISNWSWSCLEYIILGSLLREVKERFIVHVISLKVVFVAVHVIQLRLAHSYVGAYSQRHQGNGESGIE